MVRARSWSRALLLLLAPCALACAPPHVEEARHALASQRPGMGAVVYQDSGGGTLFRVWAPHATQVAVAGDWNGWSPTADPLFSEGNGNFSADVAAARAGHGYKYLIRQGGQDHWRADPRARRMTNSTGHSVIVDPGAYGWGDGGYGTPSFREAVIYELHVGSFHVPGGAPGGTWQSALDRLDHLQQLGVNLIELTPVSEFPTDRSIGYNPSYPFAPESAYGAPQDLQRFVDQAHRRGIGVLLDVVHNHWGPSDLGLWCFDGECLGAGGIYFYTDWRQHTAWGPRPDYGRAQVRDYIRDQVLQFLGDYHLDGVRWDATMVIRELAEGWALMQRVNHEVKAAQPWKLLIAEDFRGEGAITRPTFFGGAGFDSQWDGEFFHPIADNLIKQDDRQRDMGEVARALAHTFNGQATQRVIYTESHDEVANGRQRLPEMIWPGNAGSYFSRKRSTLGAGLVMTAPGIPMIFQGQELLEDGWFSAERPLDWGKLGRFPGIVTLYRDLIRLRRNWFNNTRGLRGDHCNVFHVNNNDKLVAFHRWDQGGPGDDVVVVANFAGRSYGSYQIGFPRWGTWYVRFNSDWSGYSPDFGNSNAYNPVATLGGRDGMPQSGNIGIGPYTVLILSQ